MQPHQTRFLFLNIGHFLDHLFMLLFASVAALRLSSEWGMGYAELIPYATPGFIAFGVCAIPAGWLADKWSSEGMMTIFFIGIGISSIFSGLANSPLQIAVTLGLVGIFAAIYHPVGLAMIVRNQQKTGVRLAINGVFGSMGVACAALVTGLLIDHIGWRSAFYVPGVISVVLGIMYLKIVVADDRLSPAPQKAEPEATQHNIHSSTAQSNVVSTGILVRVFGIIFFTTALGGLIYQSTTFSLPKLFDERLVGLGVSASIIGWYTFLVFALAATAQLVIGYLVDRYSIRLVFVFVALSQVIFLGAMTRLSGLGALIGAFAFMFFVFGQVPINDVLVGRMAKSEWRSRVYALRYLITFSVMASTVPLIGWIHSTWGFDRLFWLLAVAASLILIAVLQLPGQKNALLPASQS